MGIEIVDRIDDLFIINNNEFRKFIKTESKVKFLIINTKALDQYGALYTAKYQISQNIDLFNLGNYDIGVRVRDRVLVIDRENIEEGKFQRLTYFPATEYTTGTSTE